MYPDHKCRSRQKKNRRSATKKVKKSFYSTAPIPRGKKAGHPTKSLNPRRTRKSFDTLPMTHSNHSLNLYPNHPF